MAEKKAAATSTYRVLSTLHHDRTIYRKGETVDLSEEHAKPLLDLKVVKAAK